MLHFQSARTLRNRLSARLPTVGGLVFLGVGLAMSLQADVFAVYSTGTNIVTVNDPAYGPVVEDQSYTAIYSPNAGCLDSGSGCNGSLSSAATTVVDQPNVFPFGYWAPDDTSSAWISQYPGNYASPDTEAAGFYVYQTSFYLPNGVTSLSLSGLWDADNEGFGILLNPTPSQLETDISSYNSSDQSIGFLPSSLPFQITGDGVQPFFGFPPASGTFSYTGTSGFNVGGMNTLDFIVWNQPQSGGNPEGLRVEFTGADATVSGPDIATTTINGLAPEPGFYGILGLGLAGLAFAARRRRA